MWCQMGSDSRILDGGGRAAGSGRDGRPGVPRGGRAGRPGHRVLRHRAEDPFRFTSVTTNLARGFWAAAAGLALAAAFAAPAGAQARHQPPARDARAAGAPGTAAPGTQLWAARFGQSTAIPYTAMAVSPGGSMVFVTGASYGGRATEVDYKTVAYDTATGRRLWARLFSGPGHLWNYPTAVAVSPDGATVFVTGHARGWGTYRDYATVAYRAATGRQLWTSRYTSPGRHDDDASAVAVSPDGATVFVTGTSTGRRTGEDYATVAYRAATGRQLWASRYNGPGNWDEARSVAVSPDGATMFVTGTSWKDTTRDDYATVAYRAATGRQLWASRYNGPRNDWDEAQSVAVSPDGTAVFVTGSSGRDTSGGDYATVAYRAATGRRLWASRYNAPGNWDGASSVAVSPDGTTVFVTGTSTGRMTGEDYATVAYRAATGRQLWASRYNGPANNDDLAYAVAVSPDGTTVYVTGESFGGPATGFDYATVAYRAATGRRLRISRYNGPGNDLDAAYAVALSPDGTTVFVTGWSKNRTSGYDYATIAYRG